MKSVAVAVVMLVLSDRVATQSAPDFDAVVWPFLRQHCSKWCPSGKRA
jgi:hypothetical protein